MTLLTPVLFLLFIVIASLIFAYEGDEQKVIAIVDDTDVLHKAIPDEKNLYFKFPEEPLDQLKQDVQEGKYDGVLVLPPSTWRTRSICLSIIPIKGCPSPWMRP